MNIISNTLGVKTPLEKLIAEVSRWFFYCVLVSCTMVAGFFIWTGVSDKIEHLNALTESFFLGLAGLFLYGSLFLLRCGVVKNFGFNYKLLWSDFLKLLLFLVFMPLPMYLLACREALLAAQAVTSSSTLLSQLEWSIESISGVSCAVWLVVVGLSIWHKFEDDKLPKLLNKIESLPVIDQVIVFMKPVFGYMTFGYHLLVESYYGGNAGKNIQRHVEGTKREQRQAVYCDVECLDPFQKTVLTNRQEPRCLAPIIGDNFKTVKSLRVLDIGGGDGLASAELLALITSSECIIEIDLFEQEDIARQYEAHLKEIFSNRVTVTCQGLFTVREDILLAAKNYDLVVAFHSLYGIFNQNRTVDDFNWVKQYLAGKLVKDGMLVFSLASMHGVSARFKSVWMEKVHNQKLDDLNAESLVAKWGEPDEKHIVDGGFFFEDQDSQEGSDKLKSHWLQYFLRINADCVDLDICSVFDHKLIRYFDLSQQQQTIFSATKINGELERGKFFPHKTVVSVYFKDKALAAKESA